MKEISKVEYETLKDRGLQCIGKVMPYDTMTPEIYFIISPDEKSLGAKEVVEYLSKIHESFYGQFDVTCYWLPIQIVTIVHPQ